MKSKFDSSQVARILLVCGVLLSGVACRKKAPVPSPAPPPPAAVAPVPPAPPKPAIGSFTAEPSHIERGQTSTLSWSVSNATDISIDNGVGAVQSSGRRQVTPSNSTNYTLTAKGPGGTDSRSVKVEVSAPPPQPAQTVKPTAAEALASEVKDAYFDFDKFNIRPDAQQALTQDASALKQILTEFPSFTAVIEGHCDERGSAEYNLGLGDRRANAAKDFLVQLGVPADHLKTISYGKEHPVCTEQTEECYQRNRHVHFSPGQ